MLSKLLVKLPIYASATKFIFSLHQPIKLWTQRSRINYKDIRDAGMIKILVNILIQFYGEEA